MKKLSLVLAPILLIGFISCNNGESENNSEKDKTQTEISKEKSHDDSADLQLKAEVPESEYAFGDLPYSSKALEPVLSSEILELHYGKHHQGYYKKFLKAIKDAGIEGESLLSILENAADYGPAVMNNAGGYYNHWVYWDNMSPDGGGKPIGELFQAIERDFGSYEKFVEQFNTAAETQFGSGWAWLILDKENKLRIVQTPNQNNPLMSACKHHGYPLLAIDVWEHAYYPHYKNMRGSYIDAFWKVIDWDEVSDRFTVAQLGEYYMPE